MILREPASVNDLTYMILFTFVSSLRVGIVCSLHAAIDLFRALLHAILGVRLFPVTSHFPYSSTLVPLTRTIPAYVRKQRRHRNVQGVSQKIHKGRANPQKDLHFQSGSKVGRRCIINRDFR